VVAVAVDDVDVGEGFVGVQGGDFVGWGGGEEGGGCGGGGWGGGGRGRCLSGRGGGIILGGCGGGEGVSLGALGESDGGLRG